MTETNETPGTDDQDRYFIKIIGHSGAAAVYDTLAGEHAPPVRAYAGPNRLLKALAERDRLESLERAGLTGEAADRYAPESLAVSGVNPDATWKPLPTLTPAVTGPDELVRAEQAHTAALSSLAAEAEVLRRATERLLEVRGRIGKASETALSATQAVQNARWVDESMPGYPELQRRSQWLYGPVSAKSEPGA